MNHYRILIVDDDDVVRESLEDELDPNYDVTAVSSGELAIEVLKTHKFDAIISDLRMPGMGGLQVLDAAAEKDPNIVRILLTGYLDDDAREATLAPNAPFKVGKPWHEEVEVTLRRAFESREKQAQLATSVADALVVSGIDDELATADGLTDVAQVLVQRAMTVAGVQRCQVTLSLCGSERVLGGDNDYPRDSNAEYAWSLDVPISKDHSARLRACGSGVSAGDIVRFLATRALAWDHHDPASRLARRAKAPDAFDKLSAVSRRASLGTMTSALAHEMASVVQSLQGSLYELEQFVRETATKAKEPEVIEALDSAVETSTRMLSLFRAMRSFVRSGELNYRPVLLSELVEKAVALTRGHLRSKAQLIVDPVPDVEVVVSEPLLLQVLVNLLKNAAEASPKGGTIQLAVECDGKNAAFSVTDEGPGVPPGEKVFEPFVSSKNSNQGSGLGLAISHQIVTDHGGRIYHEPGVERGTRFVVSVPVDGSDSRA